MTVYVFKCFLRSPSLLDAKLHWLHLFGLIPVSLLLADILIPNKSIAQQYESYVVELASGEVLDGVIGEQTPTTITIRQEEGTERAVYRSSIRNFYLAELSAMPEDIDKQVSVQQMADLLRFIKRSR